MWFNNCFCIIFTISILFTYVKASCLEYGHSCWGAHGKRSMNIRNLKSNTLNDNVMSGKEDVDGLSLLISSYPLGLLRYTDNVKIDDNIKAIGDVNDHSRSKNLNPTVYWGQVPNEYDESSLDRRLQYFGKSSIHKKFATPLLHKRFMQRLDFNDDDNGLL